MAKKTKELPILTISDEETGTSKHYVNIAYVQSMLLSLSIMTMQSSEEAVREIKRLIDYIVNDIGEG